LTAFFIPAATTGSGFPFRHGAKSALKNKQQGKD
jgi:hypothetical protein